MTRLLARELGKSHPMVNINTADVEKIKELYACCAEDELAYSKIGDSCQLETHTLPDGQVCIWIYILTVVVFRSLVCLYACSDCNCVVELILVGVGKSYRPDLKCKIKGNKRDDRLI